MKRKHQKTLEAIFTHPVSANIQWRDIEGLFLELGAKISEREGSRIAVVLFGEVRVFTALTPRRIPTKARLRVCGNGWNSTELRNKRKYKE